MPVVINEFEVVTEAPQATRGAAVQDRQPAPAAPEAESLERELARLARRMARLRAD